MDGNGATEGDSQIQRNKMILELRCLNKDLLLDGGEWCH